jgi:hypothetical protein
MVDAGRSRSTSQPQESMPSEAAAHEFDQLAGNVPGLASHQHAPTLHLLAPHTATETSSARVSARCSGAALAGYAQVISNRAVSINQLQGLR